jgi:uncharacterized protein involved in exopolysaccharide biosynthesis
MALLRSDEVAGQVIRAHDLANDGFISQNSLGFMSTDRPPVLALGADSYSELDLATRVLQRDLELSRVGGGSEVSIAFRSASPQRAALVANEIARTYVALSNPLGSGEFETASPDSFIMSGKLLTNAVPLPEGLSGKKILLLALIGGLGLGIAGAFSIAFLRAVLAEYGIVLTLPGKLRWRPFWTRAAMLSQARLRL